MAESREGDGDGWIEVCAGDVSGGEYDYHHGQPRGGGQAEERFGSSSLLVHNWCRRPGKDEYEGAYELGSHLLSS